MPQNAARDETDHRWVAATDLRAFVAACLVALGATEADGVDAAECLVDADLRGIDSHGVHLLDLYERRIDAGHIHPQAATSVVVDDGATVLLDAGLGLGQVVGRTAIDLAVERARAHGIATVGVREATHLGALGWFTRRAADAGCLALAVQNGPTIVPAFGAVDPIFSTNPVSWAAPTAAGPPVVYDVATTTVAGNRVLMAKRRGDPTIPEGWACDAEGRPTTDTEAASVWNLQWAAGHKGFGLAFLVEVLGGLASGSSFGRTEVTDSPVHGRDRVAKGFRFVVADVDRLLPPPGTFRSRMDALVADVHASRPAPGVDAVMVPGEPEHRTAVERRRTGIPLHLSLVEHLGETAARLGVTPVPTAPSPLG